MSRVQLSRVQFLSRQYNKQVYPLYLAVERRMQWQRVVCLLVGSSLWLEAPDHVTASEATKLFYKLEQVAADKVAKAKKLTTDEEYTLNAAAYRKLYGDQTMPAGWDRKTHTVPFNPNNPYNY